MRRDVITKQNCDVTLSLFNSIGNKVAQGAIKQHTNGETQTICMWLRNSDFQVAITAQSCSKYIS